MGCLCSKESKAPETEKEGNKDANKVLVQVIAPLQREEVIVGVGNINPEGSVRLRRKTTLEVNGKPLLSAHVEDDGKTIIIERPKNGHQRRCLTMDARGVNVAQQTAIICMPNGAQGEQVAAGWPPWLASVAGEAIQGWTPRSADSYEKISKIGQGTYSSVYRARDLENGHIVAMKKVRFVNMDPESVRFMAREITILRRLDHPNVMKLEALVTSRMSDSLYLVFEYMEHDLAGLLASPKVKFTETQIKCYMKQLFLGLEHCHNRGVLHRDIKGSNLLVNNKGVLKIGDFGLATSFEPDQKQPLTSRVVTLWYRAPELLFGATDYRAEIDMWSAGCILAELFAGKPIMPGRTEVEQMHKIFKLCGSPSDEYWKKTNLPHASSFKSQHMYMRRVADTFRNFPSSALALVEVLLSIDPDQRGTASSALKSEFFTSHPLPCDPSSLPNYLPSKELDVKIREEEAKRRKAERGKSRGAEHERNSKGHTHKNSHPYTPPEEDCGTGFPIEPPRVVLKNGYSQSNSVIHPNAVGYSRPKNGKDDAGRSVPVRTFSTAAQHGTSFLRQGSQLHPSAVRLSNYDHNGAGQTSHHESMVYVPKRSRILCSGPLVPPGGNIDDMLKEHERHIQEAVRMARGEKSRA